MIRNKYGWWKEGQFEDFLDRLHAMIHRLIFYAESEDPILPAYFKSTQQKINALNRLLNYDPVIVDMMNVLEAARVEYEQQRKFTPRYRSLVFEAHELIDRIIEEKSPQDDD